MISKAELPFQEGVYVCCETLLAVEQETAASRTASKINNLFLNICFRFSENRARNIPSLFLNLQDFAGLPRDGFLP